VKILRICNDYRINRFITFLLFGIISYLSLSPNVYTPIIVKWQDKLEHIIAFVTLALFTCRSFSPTTSIDAKVTLAILIIVLYGSLNEILQSFVPNRDPSLLDLIADIFGAFLGGMLFRSVPFLRDIK